MDELLSMHGVSKTFGLAPNEVRALDGVDLDVGPGEMVAIMGPSGSGKSTLLSIAGGLEAADAGRVVLDGSDLARLSTSALAEVRRRRIGLVFQQFNLLLGLTAAENVAAPLELDGVGGRQARRQAVELLDRVGLADRADAFPDDLSGGEQQRVAIARALTGDRLLLLADEPTGALDRASGRSVMELLRTAGEGRRAVVVVTHDDEVAAGADRIVRLRDGRLDGQVTGRADAAGDHTAAVGRLGGHDVAAGR
ncbi:MAG: ABC transporter ATP-binding protein [Actinomycetota bacterium]